MTKDIRVEPVIDDGDEPLCNTSGNRPFADVLETRLARRAVLKGGAGAAAVGLFGLSLTGCGSDSKADKPGAGAGDDNDDHNDDQKDDQQPQPLIGFKAIPISGDDDIIVPEGYKYHVLLPFGESLDDDRAFSVAATGDDQARQVGSHHDGMHFFPIEGTDPFEGSSTDGLLVMNHEYVEPRFMHATAVGQSMTRSNVPVLRDAEGNVIGRDADECLKEMNAHGVTIARITKGVNNHWAVQKGDHYNRRVTACTPMEIAGPVRGSAHVVTKYSPAGEMTRGTLNNCAHGVTPWGTYMAAEENWAGYFTNGLGANSPREHSRYGVRNSGNGRYGWELANEDDDLYQRFDASPTDGTAADDFRNEPNCFGWMVEIDPFDPQSTPVKRTHLGRFAHEGVVFHAAEEGKPVVCYSGDDAQFEYIYKFVSAGNYSASKTKAQNGALLDEGTLYVAKFNDDGSGEWLPLVYGENGLDASNDFHSQADVLVNTRTAADIVGATPMDRPEWGAIDPNNGDVYFTLTNNSNRGNSGRPDVDEANPRPQNRHGHIIRWAEAGGDPAALAFDWNLYVLGGDSGQSAVPSQRGYAIVGDQYIPLTPDNMFSSPDGLWIDKDSRVWIQMDMSESVMNTDVRYVMMGNNAMLAGDPETGEIRRFLTGPLGQEITGVITTPDQRTMFINVQHPGATTTAAQWEQGELLGSWPDHKPQELPPRSATVVIWKEDGGIIGS